ncbi:hypothetical protein E2C01_101953 [Portunus trituberculatus]|uniref:Uncharacterized protein n=1 Tax=Portunus trituberculatus TaxID=210409 RepID=A0A5B7KB55_PORTR|nr:hypothetical protein [Portunus trituberculatus]
MYLMLISVNKTSVQRRRLHHNAHAKQSAPRLPIKVRRLVPDVALKKINKKRARSRYRVEQ